MSSEFGNALKVSVFGESHGDAIGVLMDGLPAGEAVDPDALQRFLDRRRPGKNILETARSEADVPRLLSGITGGRTNGSPVCAMIENRDARSGDYASFSDKPRPSHADYGAFVKWGGMADMRGGGHFSGRLTAPLCIAGGIAKQILARRGIFVGAHLSSVGAAADDPFPLFPEAPLFDAIAAKDIPVIKDTAGEGMRTEITSAAACGDSVGGTAECAIVGLPAGLGDPMFDGMENRLAKAVFGIPAIKGLEFGAGFAMSNMRGSEANDPFRAEDGKVTTESNNNGGILGGITTGMPIVFRVVIKPTPSIALPQRTVTLPDFENTELEIKGRHDPCVALRAVPALEAAAAAVALDMLLEEGKL